MQSNDINKYDINAVYNRIFNYERSHFLDDYDEESLKGDGPFYMSRMTRLLCDMEVSYCSPAIFLDHYLNAYTKQNDSNSNAEFIKVCSYASSCLLSIKAGLDRSVKLFALYDKNVKGGKYMTFGHLFNGEGNFKPEGLMAHANKNKEKDPLFEYVYNQYESWIYKCVKPRDEIVHYNDLGTVVKYNKDKGIYEPAEFVAIDHKTGGYIDPIGIDDIKKYVDSFYAFYSYIIEKITKKTKDENSKKS